ncbi:hypothetical protein BC834DRAFT_658052 [Gloeopeniophorella convolvens]|nr:hypothetical protein BC834DRAFT_658052 [Gloeopeniophorella convolvens]
MSYFLNSFPQTAGHSFIKSFASTQGGMPPPVEDQRGDPSPSTSAAGLDPHDNGRSYTLVNALGQGFPMAPRTNPQVQTTELTYPDWPSYAGLFTSTTTPSAAPAIDPNTTRLARSLSFLLLHRPLLHSFLTPLLLGSPMSPRPLSQRRHS